MRTKNQDRVAYWQRMLAELEASGLSVPAFCRTKNIAAHSLYYWRRKLSAQQARDAAWQQAFGTGRAQGVNGSRRRIGQRRGGDGWHGRDELGSDRDARVALDELRRRLAGGGPQFVPLDLTEKEGTIDVRLASGTSIVVSGPVDPEAFSLVLHTVIDAERDDA